MLKKLKRIAAVVRAYGSLNKVHTASSFSSTGSVLVFAPTSHGSFGDEALVLGTGSVIEAKSSRWTLVSPGDSAPWLRLGLSSVMPSEVGLRNNMTLWSPAGLVDDVRSLVVIGADSMDFAYGVRNASAKLSALNLAANSGAPATLFNFSLRQEISREGKRLLKFLHPDVRVVARDPLSQERAKELLGRDDVSVAPDVGILLEPQSTNASEQIRVWADTRRTAALTINNHLGVTFSSRNMLDYFVAMGKVLLGAGYEVLVVAHDTRPSPNDPALAKAVSERLGGASRVGLPSTAREAKAMISHVDVHLTSRMHAAVASLSQGIPTIGLDYVDKFRGQFSWYQAEEFVIPWHASDAKERVNQLLKNISSDGDLVDRISRSVELSKSKLEGIVL